MDKMKNFFSPGHSKDDELMYGTGSPTDNKGKVAGEGSHFGSGHSDETANSPPSSALQKESTPEKLESSQTTTTDQAPIANASKVAGQGSHFPSSEKEERSVYEEPSPRGVSDMSKSRSIENGSEAVSSSDQKMQPTASRLDNPATEDASTASIKSGVPGYQSHESSTNTAPGTVSPSKGDPGRDVDRGVGVAGGAAVAAASKAWKPGTSDGSQPAETGAGTGMPGSFPGDDENPYRTAHIDPRVDSKPSSPALSAAKSSVQATQPSTGTKVERRSSPDPSLQKETDDSHKGRNAGIGAAALGALGLGGYKAKKHDEEKANATSAPSDQPPRPTTTDTRTPSSKTANAPNSTTVQIAPDSKESPSTTDKSLTTKSSDNEKDHHYGRDAGIVGAAVGAVGLGSYETKRQSDQKNSDAGEQGPGPLGINATPSSQDTKPSDIVGQARMDMAGPGGLDDQRYDPSGTSKQHITPVGTFDRPQRDPVLQGTPSTHSGLERDTHHHGRDAGLAAGVGAAGLGAYETKKTYDSQTQPSAQRTSRENLEHEGPLSAGAPPDQMSLPRHNRGDSKSTLDDATATLLRRNADVERSPSRSASEGTQKPAQAEGGVDAGIEPPSYPNPIFRQEEATQQQDKEDDHTARNTAIGAASLDAGAYGAKKLSDLSEPDQLRADSQVPGSQSDDWPLKDSSATEAASIPPSYSTDSYDKANERAQPPEKYDHTARNAALAGAAGVGAGAYAGHEYSQHEAEKLEKERVKQQKAHEKELEKEQTQQQKASDKAAGKEAKKHEKEVAKEEKHAKKEAAKAEKKHEKEIAAQEKEQEKFGRAHEKEIADQEKEREKVEKAREQEALEAEKRHSKEVGIVAGEIPEEQKAPTSPSNKSVSSHGEEKKRHGLRRVLHKIAHPSEKEEDQVPDSPSSSHHEGRHKLHKDPPKGRYSGDDQTPSYADYAVKENEHQGAQTIRGGYTAPDVSEDPNKYPPGHAEETSPLMDKEAHFLSERFADHNIEDRVHHDTPSTATPKGS